jgi:DNA mismatch repair protein MutH
MKLEIEIKNVYGNNLIYPINDTAILITKLTHKKTLSYNDLTILKKLGCVFKIKSNEIKI